MAVTRKTDLAGYRYQVSVGGYAAFIYQHIRQHCNLNFRASESMNKFICS